MKKISFLIILGLILSIETEAKKLEGKILFDNDAVHVKFFIPVNVFSKEINYEKLQYKIKYFDSTGNKFVIKPDQAVEVRFIYKNEEVRILSRYNSLRLGNVFSVNQRIFLKLEIDGKLKMFKYYYTESSLMMYNSSSEVTTGGYSYQVDKYILQKGSQELVKVKDLTFRKDMMEYFKDCPDLSQMIERKEYRKRDLKKIVSYYNSNCSN